MELEGLAPERGRWRLTGSWSRRRWGPYRYTVGLEKLREYAVGDLRRRPVLCGDRPAGGPRAGAPRRGAGATEPLRVGHRIPTFAVVFSVVPAQAALLDPALGIDVFQVLHGEQEFEFLELLRPGDVLETTGTLVEVGTRGKHDLLRIRTDSVNQHGAASRCARLFTAIVRADTACQLTMTRCSSSCGQDAPGGVTCPTPRRRSSKPGVPSIWRSMKPARWSRFSQMTSSS